MDFIAFSIAYIALAVVVAVPFIKYVLKQDF